MSYKPINMENWVRLIPWYCLKHWNQMMLSLMKLVCVLSKLNDATTFILDRQDCQWRRRNPSSQRSTTPGLPHQGQWLQVHTSQPLNFVQISDFWDARTFLDALASKNQNPWAGKALVSLVTLMSYYLSARGHIYAKDEEKHQNSQNRGSHDYLP